MTQLDAVLACLANEPVAVATALDAVFSLLVAFGLDVNPATKTAIIGAVTALLALFARSQVVPTRRLAAPPEQPTGGPDKGDG